MKIAVDNVIFQDKKYILEAFQLLAIFTELRHQLIFPKDEKYNLSYQRLLEGTNWKRFRDEYKNSEFFTSIVKNFTLPVYNNQKPDICISANNLKEALIYLRSPLYILVENEFNDCHFIEAVIDHFGDTYTKIAYQNKWIVFKHAGGKTQMDVFMKKAKGYYKNPNWPLRVFAISDSDKNAKNEPDNANIQKLKTECISHQNSYHILYKREIENYLTKFPSTTSNTKGQPKQGKTIPEYNSFISNFTQLSDEYKDFCDIEAQFNDYFSDIKTIFPKLFLNETKNNLETRCAHHPINGKNELQIIADKIKKLL